MALNIRKNDNVEVISGKEKNRRGKVLKVLSKTQRIIIEKINLAKKHTRPTQENPQGGIVKKELSMDMSNVMLVCNKCDRPRRVGHKVIGEGDKVRVCRKCGEMFESK
ncbi:MAG: 50S ribosomal protein L24 [bacterium]